MSAWVVSLDLRWNTGGGWAGATWATPGGLILREGGVEPEHISFVVIPDGHNEDHTALHGITHLLETSLLLEVLGVAESFLGMIAHLIGDGVELLAHGVDSRLRMLNDLAVLDIFSSDFREVAVVVGNELSDNSDWLGAVNVEVGSSSIEVSDTGSEWVEVTAILVADAVVSIMLIITAGSLVRAFVLSFDSAWMSSVSSRDFVALPDVHLGAAVSILADSGIWISWRWLPSIAVGDAINELDITWALSITVSSTVVSSGFVGIAKVSSLVHINEVESAIDTAFKLGNIDGEGELLSKQLEHLVLVLRVKHEES